MRLHLWCSAVLKVGQSKRKFRGSEKENVFTFTVGRNSLMLASKCWQILYSAKHIILYTVACNKQINKQKRGGGESCHRMNSTNKDTKSPKPSNYMSLYEHKISWNSENMQMRWEKQQSKTSNQLVFVLYYSISKHETQHCWYVCVCVCVCVCVLALAQMHYLFRHVSESLQCSDMHIIKVCSATVHLSIILFPLAFHVTALQEIIPIKILYMFFTSF